MFDGTLMLQVNWPVVDPCTIHPQSNKFAKGVKIKATGELKLNDSPNMLLGLLLYEKVIFPDTSIYIKWLH